MRSFPGHEHQIWRAPPLRRRIRWDEFTIGAIFGFIVGAVVFIAVYWWGLLFLKFF